MLVVCFRSGAGSVGHRVQAAVPVTVVRSVDASGFGARPDLQEGGLGRVCRPVDRTLRKQIIPPAAYIPQPLLVLLAFLTYWEEGKKKKSLHSKLVSVLPGSASQMLRTWKCCVVFCVFFFFFLHLVCEKRVYRPHPRCAECRFLAERTVDPRPLLRLPL